MGVYTIVTLVFLWYIIGVYSAIRAITRDCNFTTKHLIPVLGLGILGLITAFAFWVMYLDDKDLVIFKKRK